MADLLCIHHVENFREKITATIHKSMSLAEAAQLYNLTLKFEAVHYISGDNDTEEKLTLNWKKTVLSLLAM